MVDCEQPTRAPTKLRFRKFQRFIVSRLTVGAQIRHGNPPFLRLTAEFERSEKPATSSETLDWLEARLAGRSYLAGARLTEADIRLFTTLIRFDSVYYGHFKCNLRRLVDYPRLWGYTRNLFQHPKIRPTVNMAHIKAHYFGSHPWLNPSGIVPIGPVLDLDAPVQPLNS
jgi:glutathionyl-hydroquinone reductase